MPPDYSGQNLRGRSFKGQNLEGANFSNTDIREADFTNANLKDANFRNAKAGLQKRRAIGLLIFSWLFAWLSGFFSIILGVFIAYIFPHKSLLQRIIRHLTDYQNDYHQYGLSHIVMNLGTTIIHFTIAITFLVVLVVFFIVALLKDLTAAFATLAAAISLAIIIVLALTVAENAIGTGAGVKTLAVAIAFAVAGAVTLALAVALTVALALTGTRALAAAVAGVGVGVGALAGTGALAVIVKVSTGKESIYGLKTITGGPILTSLHHAISASGAGASVGAGAVILFNTYIGWQILAKNEKYASVRSTAIAFAATGGTNFRNADLTDANFTDAIVKSTDFREANLTRTCFHKTKELDRVRPGTTYLQDKELRQLLVRGSGSGKDFNNRNLRGLNLSGANLVNANLIGTDFYQSSLKEADLTGAILVRTQFESTNLTDATLTGACIEDWVVTSSTKLNGIKCKYVFMKYTNRDKRDKMPQKGEFKNNDFILFVQSILDTIKLYHERDVNPKLALYVLQTLSEDYQCTLEIVKLEKRGESGAIIEVKIPGNFNQEKLKETYYEKYNQYLKFYMTDPKNELKSPTNIENVTVHKGVLIGGSLSNSTVAYTIDTEGDTMMPKSSKQQFNNNLPYAQLAGGLVNADTVSAHQIGGNINNYTPQQRQNLAEAAREIQQLLQQLEQTNPTTTNLEKMTVVAKAVDEIEKNPTLKARVFGALKSGGKEALKEAIDHSLVNILIAFIEGWQEAEQ